jgi:hypothetical protein
LGPVHYLLLRGIQVIVKQLQLLINIAGIEINEKY